MGGLGEEGPESCTSSIQRFFPSFSGGDSLATTFIPGEEPPYPGCFYNETTEQAYFLASATPDRFLQQDDERGDPGDIESDVPAVSFRSVCGIDGSECEVLCKLPRCTKTSGADPNANTCACGDATASIECGSGTDAGPYCQETHTIAGDDTLANPTCSQIPFCRRVVDGECLGVIPTAEGRRDMFNNEETTESDRCQCGTSICHLGDQGLNTFRKKQNFCHRARSACSTDPDVFAAYLWKRTDKCHTSGLQDISDDSNEDRSACISGLKSQHSWVRRVKLKTPFDMNISLDSDEYPPIGCSLTEDQENGEGCGLDLDCANDDTCMCAFYYPYDNAARDSDCSHEYSCLCRFEGPPCPKNRGKEQNLQGKSNLRSSPSPGRPIGHRPYLPTPSLLFRFGCTHVNVLTTAYLFFLLSMSVWQRSHMRWRKWTILSSFGRRQPRPMQQRAQGAYMPGCR